MKFIRTEIHITVATYIGDDIGQDGPPLSRSANSVECVSLTRVSQAFPGGGNGGVPHATAKGHVESLMANAAPIIAERVSHNVRNLHITPESS